jgi:carbonic anhydrase
MRFCTVVNCMDGRIQLPVIRYLQDRFNAEYVDSITEAGVNLILAKETNTNLIISILDRLKISVNIHHSTGIAVVGHYDCAANSASKDEQIIHLKKAINLLRKHYMSIEIIGLWVDRAWNVHEIIE